MAVRQFDGIDDDIRHTVGSTLAEMDHGTVALLFKPQPPFGDWHAQLTIAYDDRSTSANFYIVEDGNNAYFGVYSERAGTDEGIHIGPFNRWYLVVVYKEPTVGPAHISSYDYVTEQWTHDDTKNFWEWWEVGPDGIIQRSDTDADDDGHFRGLLAVQAMWANRDAFGSFEDTETAGLHQSLDAWFDAEPDALWAFNQGSVNDPVDDLVGDAAQIARVGTAVVTNDDPPGFAWGAAEEPEVEAAPASYVNRAIEGVLTTERVVLAGQAQVAHRAAASSLLVEPSHVAAQALSRHSAFASVVQVEPQSPEPGDWADNENALAWEESFGTVDLLELSGDQFVTGTQSLHVVASQSAGIQGMHAGSYQTGLPVLGNPGQGMTVRAWVRASEAFLFFTCQVRFLDEDHDYEEEITFASGSGPADEWRLFEGSVTTPAGAAFWVPRIFWGGPSGQVDIYIDAIEFELAEESPGESPAEEPEVEAALARYVNRAIEGVLTTERVVLAAQALSRHSAFASVSQVEQRVEAALASSVHRAQSGLSILEPAVVSALAETLHVAQQGSALVEPSVAAAVAPQVARAVASVLQSELLVVADTAIQVSSAIGSVVRSELAVSTALASVVDRALSSVFAVEPVATSGLATSVHVAAMSQVLQEPVVQAAVASVVHEAIASLVAVEPSAQAAVATVIHRAIAGATDTAIQASLARAVHRAFESLVGPEPVVTADAAITAHRAIQGTSGPLLVIETGLARTTHGAFASVGQVEPAAITELATSVARAVQSILVSEQAVVADVAQQVSRAVEGRAGAEIAVQASLARVMHRAIESVLQETQPYTLFMFRDVDLKDMAHDVRTKDMDHEARTWVSSGDSTVEGEPWPSQ